MKIHDQNMTGIAGTGLTKTDAVESSGGRKSGGAGDHHGDRVQISDLAQAIRDITGDSTERAQRIRQLQEEVAAGRYQVDARELSRAIVDYGLDDKP